MFQDLDKDQSHYLAKVMRVRDGDPVRVFNGRDGKWSLYVYLLTMKLGLADVTFLLQFRRMALSARDYRATGRHKGT